MRDYKLLISLFVLIAVFQSSCDDEEKIDRLPDLRQYLDRFEQEARLRGYEFDLSAVDIVYVEEIKIDDIEYCGLGYYNYAGTGQRRIEISKAKRCNFATASDTERENLVFHEIGHAFLQRAHETASQCDGTPLSLMTANSTSSMYRESESQKREYYISELIDPLVALNKCIDYGRDWNTDPVLYEYQQGDSKWIFEGISGKYSRGATDGSKLSISSESVAQGKDDGYWFAEFSNPSIPECAEVTFKVRMNSEMLTGPGATIAVRVYDAPPGLTGAQFRETSLLKPEQGPMSGKLVDHVEEVTIPCYTRSNQIVILFVVMLAGTEGTVDFDDLQVIVKPK